MSKTSPQNCTFTESNSDILTLSNSQKNITSTAANGKAESKGDNSVPAPQHPDYVQTIKIKDSNGQIKELIFPKGLDLDRPKRARTTFSNDQLASLEREFRRNQYLVGRERSQLAVNLGLSETQVKVWYQNRRTKHKRDREREQEEYSPANLSCLLSSSLSSYSSQSTNQSTSFYPFSNMSPNSQSISLNRDLFSTNHTPIGIKLELSNPAKLSKITESISSTVFEKPNDNDTKREDRRNVGPELTKQSKAEESPQTHHSLGIERLIGNDKSEHKKSQCEIPVDQSVRETSLSTLFGTFQSVPQEIASRSAFRPLMGRPFHPLYYLNSTGYQGWMS